MYAYLLLEEECVYTYLQHNILSGTKTSPNTHIYRDFRFLKYRVEVKLRVCEKKNKRKVRLERYVSSFLNRFIVEKLSPLRALLTILEIDHKGK